MISIIAAFILQLIVSTGIVIWTRAKVKKYLSTDEEIQKIRREISALINELDASADRNINILEDRIATLKELLIESEKKLASISGELKKKPITEAAPEIKKTTEDSVIPVIRFTDKKAEPSLTKQIGDSILELAQKGFSKSLIAAKLGISLSEVEEALNKKE
jgi:predicted transcriptional regulator